MPYVCISVQYRLESGPTYVGDEWSDPELMRYLDARFEKDFGFNFYHWKTDLCARVVLNRLERIGYRVVTQCGIGQTCIWTLHKEGDAEPRSVDELAEKLKNEPSVIPPEVSYLASSDANSQPLTKTDAN